jgi:ABC-type transport system involved in cytochrome bd biosynthesis fused ATPase/permease subunit
VFADDPLSGLDPGTSAQISRLIDETTAGRSLIWASTEPPATLPFPRWLWIEEGKLTYDGPPKPSLLEEVA